mmetsp:Transcript_27410/g.81692  ORF Transcript_27410/g.81692 Transcript_27410/m.81692 type:complete len:209 (-) Transcript_27410:126-752(-)
MAQDRAVDDPDDGDVDLQDPALSRQPPVLSVCVSNIDKITTDDDLVAHFSSTDPGESGVKAVEQFSNPKHTARVDLVNEASFRRAIDLDGSTLHRRSVRVEPWDDKIFDSMSALERRFASASKPVGRPRLMIKPRTKPLLEADSSRPVATGMGAWGDPFAGAPMQRRREGDTATRADSDTDWRRRPAEVAQPAKRGWCRCCRRRSSDD